MAQFKLFIVFSIVLVTLGAKKVEPPPNESCPWVGLDCLFHNIERVLDSQTWQECAEQCTFNQLCGNWSWHGPQAFISPYGCWLKSVCTQVIYDSSVVSGASTCTDAGGIIIG
eukprot:GFUD01007369.1.p1 GENE.GFUD01007369.1~~GFUD01007369.1.p1  ORF type:complete len:113 (+),score=17.21 GFUD01007369.1:2-340(+)